MSTEVNGNTFYRRRTLLALLAIVFYIDQVESKERSRLLQDGEFSIQAKVSTIRDKHSNGYEEEFIINERYSNTRRSARVEIRRLSVDGPESDPEQLNTDENTLYYYISNERRLVRLHTRTNLQVDCELGDTRKLLNSLFGTLVSYDGRITSSEWEVTNQDLPEHVVGVARLLLLVEADRDQLQLDNDGDQQIRNIKVVSYKLSTNLGSKGLEKKSTMMVSYGKSSLHGATKGESDIPLQIRLLLPGGAEICVDFTLIGHSSAEALTTQIDTSHLFIPLGLGCATKLPPSDPFNGLEPPKVASFRANLKRLWATEEGRHLGDFYIAYDGFIEALRIDTIDNHQIEAKHSMTIYEFRENRKYHILQEMSEDRREIHEDLSSLSVDERAQCVAAKVRVDDKIENLVKPLFPFGQMVEMGFSVVRGIEVRVFEHNTTKLPVFLFPQSSFLDIRGSPQLLEKISTNSLKGDLQSYSVVYYFSKAIHSDPTSASIGNPPAVGPLLRIDILSRGHPVARADIYDFVWQLGDAPNGDRQDELFSIRDRCSGIGTNRDSYAMLSLSLNHSDTTTSRTPEVESMIAFMMLRNKALSRALILNTNLRVSQLYDLESKVHVQLHNLQMRAAVKVHNQNYEVYEAITVSTAQLQRRKPPIPALNFEECFWEAAHRRKNHYLLFSYCFSSCYIDEEATQGSIDSQMFFVTPGVNLPCQVMRLDISQPDLKPPGKFWSDLYISLHALQLPIEIKGSKIPLDIAQIELRTEKGSLVEIDTKTNSLADSEDDPILDGLGLFANESIKVTTKTAGTPMNLNICQSSCLTNMGCSSFSLCITGDQVECLRSDVSFKDPELIKLIKTKVGALKSRRAIISVELSKGSYEQDDNSSKRQLKLRVERRCRIYNKYALEMFSARRRLFVTVDKGKLTPVDSVEQCAKMCLRTNTKFLKRLAKLKMNLVSKKETTVQEYWEQALEYLNRNVSSWCDTIKFRDLQNPPLEDSMRRHLDPELLTKNGLCTYSGPSWIAKAEIDALGGGGRTMDDKLEMTPTLIRMQSYNLIYTLLYERQYGIQLLPLDYSEGSAVVGGNHQVVSVKSDVEECARLCFSQTIGLKPWCKSFEWIQDASDGSNSKRTYCVFNSITAAEARLTLKPEKLIASEVNAKIRVWHYEPKNSFSFDHLVLMQLLDNAQQQSTWTGFRLQSLGVITVIALSFCTGLLLGHMVGMKLSRHISDHRESVSNPSRSFLNGLGGGHINDTSTELSYKRFEADLYLPELPELPPANKNLP